MCGGLRRRFAIRRSMHCSTMSVAVPFLSQMKVMLVIPHVSGGGGEKVLSDLSCHIRAEIVVVVFEEKFSYPIKGRVITLEAPINRASPVSRAFGFLRRVRLFRRALRKEQPDVVLSFMGEANFLNALISPRPILSVHTHMSS